MRRILLDQGLSPKAAELLRTEGWDAVHVVEVGLDFAEDLEILEFALRESRTCITLDHDFHTHLALAQSMGPSVVFVRVEGLLGPQQAELIGRVWAFCAPAIEAGSAVTVDATSIRIRALPLR